MRIGHYGSYPWAGGVRGTLLTDRNAPTIPDELFRSPDALAAFKAREVLIDYTNHRGERETRRILPIGRSRWLDGEETVAAHKGVNYAIQGGAYDILAESMISIEDAGLGDAIYLAVHDELVVETEAAPDIRKIMQQPPARLCELAERTPILRTDSLDLGERWAEA